MELSPAKVIKTSKNKLIPPSCKNTEHVMDDSSIKYNLGEIY